jgi:hypothetical protein
LKPHHPWTLPGFENCDDGFDSGASCIAAIKLDDRDRDVVANVEEASGFLLDGGKNLRRRRGREALKKSKGLLPHAVLPGFCENL